MGVGLIPEQAFDGSANQSGGELTFSDTRAFYNQLRWLRGQLVAHYAVSFASKSKTSEDLVLTPSPEVVEQLSPQLRSATTFERALFLEGRATQLKGIIDKLQAYDKTVGLKVGNIGVTGYRDGLGETLHPRSWHLLTGSQIRTPYLADDLPEPQGYDFGIPYFNTAGGLEVPASQLGVALYNGKLSIKPLPLEGTDLQ